MPPLRNTRWLLFRRGDDGWVQVAYAEGFRERELCPLATIGRDQLVLSANPSTEPFGAQYGRCDPHLHRFDAAHPDLPPVAVRPEWGGMPRFTDHSYRGLAVDPGRGDVLALNIDAQTSVQH